MTNKKVTPTHWHAQHQPSHWLHPTNDEALVARRLHEYMTNAVAQYRKGLYFEASSYTADYLAWAGYLHDLGGGVYVPTHVGVFVTEHPRVHVPGWLEDGKPSQGWKEWQHEARIARHANVPGLTETGTWDPWASLVQEAKEMRDEREYNGG